MSDNKRYVKLDKYGGFALLLWPVIAAGLALRPGVFPSGRI